MTLAVDFFVGAVRSNLALPDLPLMLAARPVEDFLTAAGTDPSGAVRVAVGQNTSRLNVSVLPPSIPTDSQSLTVAMGRLVGSQGTQVRPMRVALLLADRYAPHDSALGLMFDASPFPGDPPRQGCAVFVNAIRDLRHHEGPEAEGTEIGFTAVHELGHVFNLWHQHSPPNAPNFMARSGLAVYDRRAFFVDPFQRRFLWLADTDPRVRPGGDAYGVRPPGWPQGDDPFNAGPRRRPRQPPVKLEVRAHQLEFWPFEPIELDIVLSVSGTRRTVEIPDEIDPGYAPFTIWIEDPNGERRHYRSPRRYCQNPSTISIQAGHPFRRDISLFLNAGGYTFRAPGICRVWATLDLPNGARLESKPVSLCVKSASPKDAGYRALERVLTDSRVTRLLYYRRGVVPRREAGELVAFARRYRRTFSGAMVRYATGRALTSQAVRATGTRRRGLIKEALRHLQQATDDPLLGPHQRRTSRVLAARLRG